MFAPISASFGIILAPRAMFAPISAFLLFVVSAVARREECAFSRFRPFFSFLLQI